MSSVNLDYHIVFGTRDRRNLIGKTLRSRLYKYINGILQNLDGRLLNIGGTSDHVHILAALDQTTNVASVVYDIESNSTRWVDDLDDYHSTFRWQSKYGACTVSRSRLTELREYIDNQQERHRRKTFREEFLQFLRKYGIDDDEDYLWE